MTARATSRSTARPSGGAVLVELAQAQLEVVDALVAVGRGLGQPAGRPGLGQQVGAAVGPEAAAGRRGASGARSATQSATSTSGWPS